MKLVAAVDENWGIGSEGSLLYRFPEDMKRFKQITTESGIVIMGRKTFDSLGHRALKDRENWVLTRDKQFNSKNVRVFHFLDDLFTTFILEEINPKSICVIGGAEIYKQMLPYCSKAYITYIKAKHPRVDTYFPVNLDQDPNWVLERSEQGRECIYLGTDYRFNYYTRILG